MRILELKAKNFRGFSELSLTFPHETFLIVGDNARGKTNVLDAIWTLCVGTSFRGSDRAAVKLGEQFFYLQGKFESAGKTYRVEVGYEPRPIKTIQINSDRSSAAGLKKLFPVLIFLPEEMEIVFGGPESRRRFFNRLLSQLEHSYLIALVNYRRTLEQRNMLLTRINQGFAQESELLVWDEKLTRWGGEIITHRLSLIERLTPHYRKTHQRIAPDAGHPLITYLSPYTNGEEGESAFRTALEAARKADLQTELTTVGPHRDDFDFVVSNRSLKDYGSRGEGRTGVLSLKLAAFQFLSEKGETPLVLLDDVFSELDSGRRSFLFEELSGGQKIITTSEPPEALSFLGTAPSVALGDVIQRL